VKSAKLTHIKLELKISTPDCFSDIHPLGSGGTGMGSPTKVVAWDPVGIVDADII